MGHFASLGALSMDVDVERNREEGLIWLSIRSEEGSTRGSKSLN
jgi:hypothetical protein